jgi:ATP-dependent Clp protease protease subunit
MDIKKDFDEEDENRIIVLNEIDESPISNAISTLLGFAKKNKKSPINIIINTFGGNIYDMFALYDTIKYVQSQGIPVHTIGLGKIMSAGVILLAVGNNRKIGRNATIMWHVGRDEVSGDIFEIKNDLNEFNRLESLCNKVLSSDTIISDEKMKEMLSPRIDVYITPAEAIKYGIVDGYLEASESKYNSLSKKTDKKTKAKK